MISQLKEHLNLKSLHFQNVAVPLVTKVLTSVLYIVVIPYAINRIGAQAYGIVAYFLMLHGYVSLFDSGFSYAFGLRYARSLAASDGRSVRIAEGSSSIYLVLSAVAFLTFFIFSHQLSQLFFSNDEHAYSVALFGITLALSVIDSFFVVMIQAHNQVRLINMNRFFLDAIKIASIFVLVWLGLPPDDILYGFILATLTKLVLDILVVKRMTGRHFVVLKWFPNEWGENLSMAGGSLAVAGLSLLMSLADKTMVNRGLSSEQFAAYSFSFDLTQKSYFLMYAVVGATYPTLMKRYAMNRPAVDLIKINLIALSGITLFYYFPLAVFGGPVLAHFVKPDFAESTAAILPYSAFAAVLYLLFNVFETHLNAQGKIKKVMMIYTVGLITLTCGLYFLMPTLGMRGAALSVLAMFASMNVSVFLVMKFGL